MKKRNSKHWYFVCVDRADDWVRLYNALEADGYRFFNVNRRDFRDDPDRYRYFPLHIDTTDRYVSVMNVTSAAAACTRKRTYTPDEFLLLREHGLQTDLPEVLFHVPHDGWKFPKELMSSVCIPKDEFMKYHEIIRDKHVFQLIPAAYRTGRCL